MKNKLKELDVDFIGGEKPLTHEEALAISAYIKAYKEKAALKEKRKAAKSLLVQQNLQHPSPVGFSEVD
jgi:hypothetical protein